MRTVLDKNCRENVSIQSIFGNFIPRIVPFVILCGKYMEEPERPQITIQYGSFAL